MIGKALSKNTFHMNKLRMKKNTPLGAARVELARLVKQRENLIQAIKDGVPAYEVKDDLARLVIRREELETLLVGTKEEPVLLHPMAAEYHKRVANLAQVLNQKKTGPKRPIILRSLVERIELRPNQQGKLDIDLHGDLAGILSLAGKKDRPFDQNGLSFQQVKVVAGIGFEPMTFRL
jgi:site-specific DNA recombinase